MAVRGKSDGLEFVKALACVFVVILHTVENGGGIEKTRLFIYFLGTFGIPLFFMANGYALGTRLSSNNYLANKIINYVCFIFQWILVISIPVLIINRNIRSVLSLVKGTIVGSGYLYALWFIPALCIVYFILIVRNCIFRNVHSNVAKKYNLFIMAVSILALEYFANRVLLRLTGCEIRDILWPPFRVFISLGYFFIGVELKNRLSETSISHKCIIFARVAVIMGLLYLLFETMQGDIIWASSYYGSPFIAMACVGIFVLCIGMEGSVSNKILLFSKQTTGIWVIHPFVILIYNKFMASVLPVLLTENFLYVLIRLIVVISISFLVSAAMQKFEITRRFVDISACKLEIL